MPNIASQVTFQNMDTTKKKKKIGDYFGCYHSTRNLLFGVG